MNQAVNAFSMRRNRYTGLAKTRLQHIATSVAVNFQRLWAWLNGIPTAKTKTYPFAILAP
jgi:transposase